MPQNYAPYALDLSKDSDWKVEQRFEKVSYRLKQSRHWKWLFALFLGLRPGREHYQDTNRVLLIISFWRLKPEEVNDFKAVLLHGDAKIDYRGYNAIGTPSSLAPEALKVEKDHARALCVLKLSCKGQEAGGALSALALTSLRMLRSA